MKTVLAQLVFVLLLVSSDAIDICMAQTASPPAPAVSLPDLNFISGLWRAEWGGGLGEEHWSKSSGDSMVGTFRFVKGGKARFYELMLIEETTEGLVLRLKHFSPGLIGWEEKAQVHNYPLTAYQKGLAIFERSDKKSRLTFRRTSEDTLSVVLDQITEGKENSEEFKFRLIKGSDGISLIPFRPQNSQPAMEEPISLNGVSMRVVSTAQSGESKHRNAFPVCTGRYICIRAIRRR